jgi:hypothetical protein
MTIEETKERIAVMQAYVDGKQIQGECSDGKWADVPEPSWSINGNFRVKPEPKYRPFKDAEECWQEMLKHQPFGWTKKTCGHCNFLHIMELYSTGIVINMVDNFGCFKNLLETYGLAFAEITFADGAPFGVKEGIWEN